MLFDEAVDKRPVDILHEDFDVAFSSGGVVKVSLVQFLRR